MEQYLQFCRSQLPANLAKLNGSDIIDSSFMGTSEPVSLPTALLKIIQFLTCRYMSGGSSLTTSRNVSLKKLMLARISNSNSDSKAIKLAKSFDSYFYSLNYLKSKKHLSIEDLCHVHLKLTEDRCKAGKIRNKQNYVGRKNSSNKFIPPVHTDVRSLMEDLCFFINSERYLPLEKAFYSYIQFSLIHPFNDGNGRIARLLWDTIITSEQAILNPSLFRLHGSEAQIKYKSAIEFTLNDAASDKEKQFWMDACSWSKAKLENILVLYFKYVFKLVCANPLYVIRYRNRAIEFLSLRPLLSEKEYSEAVQKAPKLKNSKTYTKRKFKQGGYVYECKLAMDFLIQLENLIFE